MNVQTIDFDPAATKATLEAYRGRVGRRHDAELVAMTKALEALDGKTAVLDLVKVFEEAERDAHDRPLLALGRADRPEVCTYWSARKTLVFDCRRVAGVFDHRYRDTTLYHEIQLERNVPAIGEPIGPRRSGFALVPKCPPSVWPGGQEKDYLTLFEVEEGWSDTSHGAQVDADPMLLKHLMGTLYTVEAVWELTDLERTLLQGIRRG